MCDTGKWKPQGKAFGVTKHQYLNPGINFYLTHPVIKITLEDTHITFERKCI